MLQNARYGHSDVANRSISTRRANLTCSEGREPCEGRPNSKSGNNPSGNASRVQRIPGHLEPSRRTPILSITAPLAVTEEMATKEENALQGTETETTIGL